MLSRPATRSRPVARLLVAGAALLAEACSCGESTVADPFGVDDTAPDGGDVVDASRTRDARVVLVAPDAGDDAAELGGPCATDSDCDDMVDCTFDACDLVLHRCRFKPEDSACVDDSFCNGIERCRAGRGCIPGDPVTCSDDTTCTIDRCDETTGACLHEPRDADQDGDPDQHCEGGGDCDETDPLISSTASERCQNARDDDCDGEVDETGCVSPAFDTCFDPLVISAAGTFVVDLRAAARDMSPSCGPTGSQTRDLVVALEVTGGPIDIDVVARSVRGSLGLSHFADCGDASSELACAGSFEHANSGSVTRLPLRALEDGSHALVLTGSGAELVDLRVDYREPRPAPNNETCGSAVQVTPGGPFVVDLTLAAGDLASECELTAGELVYAFDLDLEQDVHVYASSRDGVGEPVLSLRDADCSRAANEVTCATADNLDLFVRALPAGRHHLAVSASAPTELDVVIDARAPTSPPASENCATAPRLVLGRDTLVDLTDHVDDVRVDCLDGGRDAAFSVEVGARSDVLVLGVLSEGDRGGLSVAGPACDVAGRAVCATGSRSPLRALALDQPAGSHRVVAESERGNPLWLTAFSRPSRPVLLAAAADDCSDPLSIPADGATIEGNTANAEPDFVAPCDLGGEGSTDGPDQLLRLDLPGPRRVVFDTSRSAFATVLVVRRGDMCPGDEVIGCSAGYYADRSVLDLDLEGGTYFAQIDGYAGAQGNWVLDVFVAEP